jgi:hypothetical protein
MHCRVGRDTFKAANFCDFQCDFLLLIDVKEWINNGCSDYMFLMTGLLIHIYQKEKIGRT